MSLRSGSDTNGDYSEEELSDMTKAELLALADELGVTGVSSSNLKADIINAILSR